jgi:oligosaccharyltransferase complex subunit gamma
MRLLNFLTAGLLPCIALAATDRFTEYNAKSVPMKMDDKMWNELTKAPRDYSIAVLLTAMDPKFGCGLCQEFQSDWDIMAKSWKNGDKASESRLLFGTLDFENGKNTFQSV